MESALYAADSGTAGRGQVYLIGAGPGDPELLTLKAVRILGIADLILLDDLVNPDITKFVKDTALIIPVGKRGGCKSTSQEFIHDSMIAAARAGLCVARVKGGDPLIFGRGGEEIQALREAGIPVTVVSGVTAATSVPATLGIPLTHRDHAQIVSFVTGCHRAGGPEPDWRALAQSGGTLVIFMGLANLSHIVSSLIAGGLAPSTSAAAIADGTLPQQKNVLAPLAELPDLVRESGITSPALIIVGSVVSCAEPSREAISSVCAFAGRLPLRQSPTGAKEKISSD